MWVASGIRRLFRTGDGEPRPFCAQNYWEFRHRDQRESFRAVANQRLSEQANAQQYEVKRSRVLEVIRRYVPEPCDKTLLDAGCGIELFTKAFVDLGFRVTGVDFSPTAVAEARRRSADAEFLVDSLSEMDMGRRFDVIAVIDVFLHIVEDDEWLRAVKALSRLLASDGVLVIIDWIDGTHQRAEPHCVGRSMKAYASALVGAGLHIDLVERFDLTHEGATKHLLAGRSVAVG